MKLDLTNKLMRLLNRVAVAYDQSEIKHKEPGSYYSLLATRPERGGVLLVGFNWSSGNGPFRPQVEIPTNSFEEIASYDQLGIMYHSIPYLETFAKVKTQELVVSNLCFFRSRRENDISLVDLKLTLPLFLEFVQVLEPRMIIGLSSAFRSFFENSPNLAEAELFVENSGKVTGYALKGYLKTKTGKVPLYALPHPGARLKTETREKLWKKCFQ